MAAYSEKYKFLFIHIYKCGGTSFRDVLHSNHIDYVEIGKAHGSIRDAGLEFVNKDQAQVFHDAFRFSFVRNPYHWIASLYDYMRGYGNHFHYREIANLSFPAFVDWLIKAIAEGKTTPNGRYMTMSDFLCSETGQPLCNYIGRVESLEHDISEVMQSLNIPFNHRVPVSNKNLKYHGILSPLMYGTYYNADTIKRVNDFFSKDFELFNYQKI